MSSDDFQFGGEPDAKRAPIYKSEYRIVKIKKQVYYLAQIDYLNSEIINVEYPLFVDCKTPQGVLLTLDDMLAGTKLPVLELKDIPQHLRVVFRQEYFHLSKLKN